MQRLPLSVQSISSTETTNVIKLSARDITIHAILVTLALALSLLEAAIPIPIPGVKLGLANTVTLFALYTFNPLSALLILFARCILATVFGGGITSLLFSLCGGILALFAMILTRSCKLFSIYGVSIAGAAAHGIGQIIAACCMFLSFSAVSYLPFLLFSALFTGSITAFISNILISRLPKMYKR